MKHTRAVHVVVHCNCNTRARKCCSRICHRTHTHTRYMHRQTHTYTQILLNTPYMLYTNCTLTSSVLQTHTHKPTHFGDDISENGRRHIHTNPLTLATTSVRMGDASMSVFRRVSANGALSKLGLIGVSMRSNSPSSE